MTKHYPLHPGQTHMEPQFVQIPLEEYESIKKRILQLETESDWHRCDKPNEDGLYNLPSEPGDYLVEFVDANNEGVVVQSTFDPDYSDWDPTPFDCKARQWREMPKAPEV